MDPLLYLLVALAPGAFWLWRIWATRRYRPDAGRFVVQGFALGMLCTPAIAGVAMLSSVGLDELMPVATSNQQAATTAFIRAGLVEELGKLAVIWLALRRSPYFTDTTAAIAYGSAVALGFASVENAIYMATYAPSVIVPRAVLSTLGHVVFSLGLAVGLAGRRRFAESRPWVSWLLLILGTTYAVFVHGLYDWFLMREPMQMEWALTTWALGLVVFIVALRRARAQSPLRSLVASARRRCPRCGGFCLSSATQCMQCDVDLRPFVHHPLECSQCGNALVPGSRYCDGCGCHLRYGE